MSLQHKPKFPNLHWQEDKALADLFSVSLRVQGTTIRNRM
jgi:hypothetical protein